VCQWGVRHFLPEKGNGFPHFPFRKQNRRRTVLYGGGFELTILLFRRFA
jgi:hypothetical protein